MRYTCNSDLHYRSLTERCKDATIGWGTNTRSLSVAKLPLYRSGLIRLGLEEVGPFSENILSGFEHHLLDAHEMSSLFMFQACWALYTHAHFEKVAHRSTTLWQALR